MTHIGKAKIKYILDLYRNISSLSVNMVIDVGKAELNLIVKRVDSYQYQLGVAGKFKAPWVASGSIDTIIYKLDEINAPEYLN